MASRDSEDFTMASDASEGSTMIWTAEAARHASLALTRSIPEGEYAYRWRVKLSYKPEDWEESLWTKKLVKQLANETPLQILHSLVSLARSHPFADEVYVSVEDCLAAPLLLSGKGGSITEPNVDELLAEAQPSHFGRHQETVYDETVRKSVEILAANLNPQILDVVGKQVAADMTFAPGHQLAAVPYKLCIYQEGSFFAAHRDTVRHPNHIGTAIVYLPTEFTGGAFQVRHKDESSSFSGPYMLEDNKLTAVRIYGDCFHEIKPVESGVRITLLYDILDVGFVAPPLPDHEDENLLRLALTSIMQKFSGVVVGLNHAYPQDQLLVKHLKGGDYYLYKWLEQAAKSIQHQAGGGDDAAGGVGVSSAAGGLGDRGSAGGSGGAGGDGGAAGGGAAGGGAANGDAESSSGMPIRVFLVLLLVRDCTTYPSYDNDEEKEVVTASKFPFDRDSLQLPSDNVVVIMPKHCGTVHDEEINYTGNESDGQLGIYLSCGVALMRGGTGVEQLKRRLESW